MSPANLATLNTAMLELQSALTARSLYPKAHPRIRSVETRAYELLSEVTNQIPEVTVFALGERVIFGETTLPASAVLSESLFRVLQQNGVDRISFRKGLVAIEICQLLDSLVEEGRDNVRASAHVSLGFMQKTIAPSATPMVQQALEAPLTTDLADALRGVWSDVHEGRQLSSDILGDIFLSISRAMSDSSCAVLPLATVKRHDEYTFVHTINVAMLSTALGESVGFRNRLTHELNMAALLHDVGKQLVPRELLNKNGKFTDEEFRTVQLHPVDGARVLLATPGVPDMAPIVAFEHHVRADGGGYPKLPRNWKLSMASRIVQVADVFDALRTHRPYRPAMPLSKILEIMRKDIGGFFDGDLLEVFFEKVVSRGVPEPAPLEAPVDL